MAEITLSNNNNNVKKMCRLCLVSDNKLTNMFTISSKWGLLIADVVMKCATIHVIQEDDLPDSICGLCYTEIERIHQFQTRAVQFDKTLRRRLQQQQSGTSIQRIRKTKKTSGEVTVKSENILENKDFYQLSLKKENPSDVSEDDKNTSVNQVVKVESARVIKEEPINDTKMDTNNKEDIVNDNEDKNTSVVFKIESECIIKKEPINDTKMDTDNKEDIVNDNEDKNTSVDQVFKIESECLIKEEPINDTELDTNNEEGKVNVSEETRFDFLEPNDNIKSEQMESSVPQFEPVNEFPEKNLAKPYQCDVCKECFHTKYKLQKHKPTHPSKKRCFPCDVCKRVFKYRSRLVLHKLSHEKEQSCDICDQRFTSRYLLNVHKLTHAEEVTHSYLNLIWSNQSL